MIDHLQLSKFQCRFCLEIYDTVEVVDHISEGFWCDMCEGFTYFDGSLEESRKYTLILEGKAKQNEFAHTTGGIKLNKRLSPLRYPGGKSKLADYLMSHMNLDKTEILCSPYAGGSSVELALLYANVFKKLKINDVDFGVFSLFTLIKEFPEALTLEIQNRIPNHSDYIEARKLIKNDYINADMFEAAYSLLLVNRLAFSGIYKANPLGGLRGTKESLLSRWNADDLCNRIMKIHRMRDRFTVYNQDALEFIEENYWHERALLLIDPPYYDKGKDLYLHYYKEDDHYNLQFLLDQLYKETPQADVIVTYDDVPFIENIYCYPEVHKIQRKFSA